MWTTPRHVLVLCEFMLLCLIFSSIGSSTTNKKSTRMSRMPLYYGKRSETWSGKDSVHLQSWAERSRSSNNSAALHSVAGEDKQAGGAHGEDVDMNEYLPSGIQLNKILDLDTGYSSENQQHSYDPLGQSVKRNLKMLYRMPAYFGKRPVMATDKFDEFNLFEEYLKKKFLVAHPHVPDFYSTKVQTYPGWNYLKFQDFNLVKRNTLSRMPNFYGKRGHGYLGSDPTNKNVMNILMSYFKTHNENQIPKLHTIVSRISSRGRTEHRKVSATSFNLPERSGIKQGDITDKYSTRLGHNSPSVNRADEKHHNKYDDTDDDRADEKHDNNYDYSDDNIFSDDRYVLDNDDTNMDFNKRRFVNFRHNAEVLRETAS